MQDVRFVTSLFVIVVTVLAASVLPYTLLFVVQRKTKVSCLMALTLVLVGGVLGFVVSFSLRFQVEASLAVPIIQAAVDAQCGAGAVTVDTAGYSSEPYASWLGEGVGCQYIDFEGEWECYCDTEGSPSP